MREAKSWTSANKLEESSVLQAPGPGPHLLLFTHCAALLRFFSGLTLGSPGVI